MSILGVGEAYKEGPNTCWITNISELRMKSTKLEIPTQIHEAGYCT